MSGLDGIDGGILSPPPCQQHLLQPHQLFVAQYPVEEHDFAVVDIVGSETARIAGQPEEGVSVQRGPEPFIRGSTFGSTRFPEECLERHSPSR